MTGRIAFTTGAVRGTGGAIARMTTIRERAWR
jgi:hypothetical protein